MFPFFFMCSIFSNNFYYLPQRCHLQRFCLARIGSEITVRIVRTTATPAEIDIHPNNMKTSTSVAKVQMSMTSAMKMIN